MPISPDAPSGTSLQYDPLFDQIAEARTEDDPSIPMGEWSRPVKRTDLPLVLSLTRNALEQRSKDLWLAVWFGEATLKSEGLSAAPSILDLLHQMQSHFWDTLFPECDGDDLGARSAPLQWALTRYTALLLELPLITSTISLTDFRRSRLPSAPPEERDLVDASLAAIPKSAFVATESLLACMQQSLRELQTFCDQSFGDDSPSFVPFRSLTEEALNTISNLLRLRREMEPDPIEPEPASRPDTAPSPAFESPSLSAGEPSISSQSLNGSEPSAEPDRYEPNTGLEPADDEPPEPGPPQTDASQVVSPLQLPAPPTDWSSALDQLHTIALFFSRAESSQPLAYLLLASAAWAHAQASTTLPPAPSSDLRRSLRALRSDERWPELLDASLQALTTPASAAWFDLHRYIWLAATHTGATHLASNALTLVEVLLVSTTLTPQATFKDDTPVAAAETRTWINEHILTPPASPEVPAPACPTTSSPPSADVSDPLPAQAAALATAGDLQGAVALLLNEANSTSIRRRQFFSRLEVARLCVSSGSFSVAARLLTRLLAEADSLHLEAWEDPDLAAELITLLLQCPASEIPHPDCPELLNRLAHLSPLRALQLQAHLPAQPATELAEDFA